MTTVEKLEQWLDAFDAHLYEIDVLDYPGAEKQADARVFTGVLGSVAEIKWALGVDYHAALGLKF